MDAPKKKKGHPGCRLKKPTSENITPDDKPRSLAEQVLDLASRTKGVTRNEAKESIRRNVNAIIRRLREQGMLRVGNQQRKSPRGKRVDVFFRAEKSTARSL